MWALMVIETCRQVLWDFLCVTFLSLFPSLKYASGVLKEPQVESQGHLDLGRTILPNVKPNHPGPSLVHPSQHLCT